MKKWIAIAVFGILAGAVAGWALRGSGESGRQPAKAAQVREADPPPEEPAARTVSLGPDAAKNMGLRVTILRPVRHAPQFRTNAVVLSPQSLAALTSAYDTDVKNLAMARANLLVARNEFRRQNTLYRENQNTSLKALQAARGALKASQAQDAAARRQLRLDGLAAAQQWGPVVGKWLASRSHSLEKILAQQQWLVEITFAASVPRPTPRIARLIAPSGAAVPARLVSSFPQTNPVIQGVNFLYVIPARPGFAPGLNLIAEMPAGPARSGVVIPAAAVVWSHGEAWAYKQIGTNRFERFPVATDEPVTNGWFVTTGFAAGDHVVTGAAEELFSAEAQAAGGNQSEEGDDD